MAQFLPLPDPYTPEDAEEFVSRLGDEGRREGVGIGSAVVESATGELVGSAALRLPIRGATAEVGYWISPRRQGRGYAGEVARTLAEWALANGVIRVEIFCAARNLASAAAALAAGFSFESFLRRAERTPGGYAERAVFSRLATDSGHPVVPRRPRLRPGELGDGVIELRVIEPADAPALIAEAHDAEERRWALLAPPTGPAELAISAERAALEWMVGPVGRLAVIDTETGRFAGSVQLRQGGPPQIANIGYSVQAAFRGRGYTTRALRLLIHWVFTATDITRLELGAKSANMASRRAAERAGFTQESVGRSRLRNPDGTFSDEIGYALLRPDLVAQPSATDEPIS
jgi:RimJ/RimL family protein N-acetyltransferase